MWYFDVQSTDLLGDQPHETWNFKVVGSNVKIGE